MISYLVCKKLVSGGNEIMSMKVKRETFGENRYERGPVGFTDFVFVRGWIPVG